ncbi:MAG TPA: SAM-dependent methyltransferase, partial [Bacteroidia bacterium]|nr:SAM-dependent methyltransferase [Bacteroidia bacterium]
TPFRNNHLLEDLLKNCSSTTMLCVAMDLTLPDEFIQTQSINDWKRKIPNLHKRPAIFLLYK